MIASFFITFGTVSSWLLLLVVIPFLRRKLLDKPNSRSSHIQPIPRGGGVVFVFMSTFFSILGLFTESISIFYFIPLLALPLAIVGLIDDRHNLPAILRYGFQIFTAVLMLSVSSLVHQYFLASLSGSLFLLPVFFALIIAFTSIINFTNFMDGLDGLVAGCMSVSIAALSLSLHVTSSIWILVGSLFGFLLWNWSPAKVFMGDVGSTFLGAVFAGLVLQASSWSDVVGYLLIATPLLADAFFCVLRRLLAGHRVFQAHRLHLYQRLYQAGWSHARVSLTYISATVVLALAMLLGGLPWVFSLAFLGFLLGFWLDQCFAVPFLVASKS